MKNIRLLILTLSLIFFGLLVALHFRYEIIPVSEQHSIALKLDRWNGHVNVIGPGSINSDEQGNVVDHSPKYIDIAVQEIGRMDNE